MICTDLPHTLDFAVSNGTIGHAASNDTRSWGVGRCTPQDFKRRALSQTTDPLKTDMSENLNYITSSGA
jgi:hypothetical protein